LAAASRQLCWGRGEGLPGHAWEEGKPVLLRQFEGSYFRRTEAAHAAGLSCAIAWPLWVHDRLTSVLVLFCGHDAATACGLELWHHDAQTGDDMTLVDGAYGTKAQSFESISRQTRLPRGVGLPGQARDRGEAVFLEDLPVSSERFVRAGEAAAVGLLRGLAIPVAAQRTDNHAVTFLAGSALPLARRIERWTLDQTAAQLRRVYAFSELHGGASLVEATLPFSALAPEGSIAKACASGAPEISDWPAAEPGVSAAAATAIGTWALLAIPVMREGAVVEVLALYL
jgi:hypothetical protein